MKSILAGIALAASVNLAATTFSIEWLRVELAPGWVYEMDEVAPTRSGFSDEVRAHHPDGVGVLHLQAYTAPATVNDEALRRLTNVPATEHLVRRRWGDFSGYLYDYVDGDLFHRTWWLAHGQNIVLITYQCRADRRDAEIDQVDEIVQSLSLTHP